MTTATSDETGPALSVAPTDGPLLLEELQLAFRNRGMPLEALRYDLTPGGLHYLVIHFDIPEVDPATWRLAVGGRVRRPLELRLDDIQARPSQTVRVTLECAGNGRGRLSPRPISLPWLHEAIGTAEWTGTSLWPLLEEAGVEPDAVELAFFGADRGVQGGEEQDYGRSLTLAEARRPEVILAYAMNGQPLQAQHGFPLRLLVPGWYGMTSVKWLRSIEAVAEPFRGYLSLSARRDRPGRAGQPHPGARAHDPARDPRLLHPPAVRGPRPRPARRPGVVRSRADRARRGRRRRRVE
jgi:DMSO/TMAO reductase YedYZ molybdopterin-dependent catalytic subunit